MQVVWGVQHVENVLIQQRYSTQHFVAEKHVFPSLRRVILLEIVHLQVFPCNWYRNLRVTGPFGSFSPMCQFYVSCELVSNGHSSRICGSVPVCLCSAQPLTELRTQQPLCFSPVSPFFPLISARLQTRLTKPWDSHKCYAPFETCSTHSGKFASDCVHPLICSCAISKHTGNTHFVLEVNFSFRFRCRHLGVRC